jgi:hypothetical protein
VDNSVNNFIDMVSIRLDPSKNSTLYKGQAFEFYAQSDFASQFKDKTYKIKSNDVYWKTPADLFQHNQG